MPRRSALGVKPGLKRATALALAPQIVLGQADPSRDALALAAGGACGAGVHAQRLVAAARCSPAPLPTRCCSRCRRACAISAAWSGCCQAIGAALRRSAIACTPPARRRRKARRSSPGSSRRRNAPTSPRPASPSRRRRSGCSARGASTGRRCRAWACARSTTCCILPRAGLARRFGEGLLVELDRAFGRRPDPREPIVLPPSFESRLELFARADTTDQVLHGAACCSSG